MFSTAGATASSGVPGERRATVAMAAITVQAPILSIFISSIRSAGLMLMPPESKQTPLPTIARCRPSASFSPSSPERMTIIRGGLSLPWPTARNMPMPSSRARSGSMTSIHRPCFSASARDSSARTSGVTSFAERFEIARAQFEPSPMTIPRSAAFESAAASSPGATRISSSSCGGAPSTVRAVQALGVERALDDAAGEELRDGRCATVEDGGERRDPQGEGLRLAAAEPALGRRADPHDGLAVELAASPAPTVTTRPAGRSPGLRRPSSSACPRLLERGQGLDLAADPPVDLAEGAVERRVTDDRDRQDVGLDVPGLVGDNTQLHAVNLLRSLGRAPRAAPSGQWSAVYFGAGASGRRRGRRRRSARRLGTRRRGRPGGVDHPDRGVQVAPRLLDRDHRLVEPAPADLGEDDRRAPSSRRGAACEPCPRRRTRRGPRSSPGPSSRRAPGRGCGAPRRTPSSRRASRSASRRRPCSRACP